MLRRAYDLTLTACAVSVVMIGAVAVTAWYVFGPVRR
jgi:hypothetical protein